MGHRHCLEQGRLACGTHNQGFAAEQDLTIGDNEPYSGRDSGFSLQAHPEPRGYPHFGVEFRQDLVASGKDAREQARILETHWKSRFGRLLFEKN